MSEPQNVSVPAEQETLPPSPDQVALALIQGLAASGQFEDMAALIGNAWAAVPHFYISREHYADKIAPMFFLPVGGVALDSVAEPDFAGQLAAVRENLRREDEGPAEDAPSGPSRGAFIPKPPYERD